MKITRKILFMCWCTIWIITHIFFIQFYCTDYVDIFNNLYWNQTLALLYIVYLSTIFHLWYKVSNTIWFLILWFWCIANIISNIMTILYYKIDDIKENEACTIKIVFSEEIIWFMISIALEIIDKCNNREPHIKFKSISKEIDDNNNNNNRNSLSNNNNDNNNNNNHQMLDLNDPDDEELFNNNRKDPNEDFINNNNITDDEEKKVF